MNNVPNSELLYLTALITSAHLARNPVPTEDMDGLIRAVYGSLAAAEGGHQSPVADKPKPAVPVKGSIFPNYLICLEDGKKFRMLKRHLKAAYGLTPQAYRERWNLPDNYPMVAANYAAHRSALAKRAGLGHPRQQVTVKDPAESLVQRIPEGKRGKRVAKSDQPERPPSLMFTKPPSDPPSI